MCSQQEKTLARGGLSGAEGRPRGLGGGRWREGERWLAQQSSGARESHLPLGGISAASRRCSKLCGPRDASAGPGTKRKCEWCRSSGSRPRSSWKGRRPSRRERWVCPVRRPRSCREAAEEELRGGAALLRRVRRRAEGAWRRGVRRGVREGSPTPTASSGEEWGRRKRQRRRARRRAAMPRPAPRRPPHSRAAPP